MKLVTDAINGAKFKYLEFTFVAKTQDLTIFSCLMYNYKYIIVNENFCGTNFLTLRLLLT